MSDDEEPRTVKFSPNGPALPVPDIDLSRYLSGEDRYILFAEEVLGRKPHYQQRQILRALAKHQFVIVMSANAIGKSYSVALGKLGFIFTNVDSIVLGTSGSYSQYVDGVWRPLEDIHEEAAQRVGLPGQILSGKQQPRLEISNQWYAKVISPRDPGDLEGRHGADVMVVLEEADKEYITSEHFDSAASSISGSSDRMIAVCNPPKSQSNSVYEKLESDRWHVIQLSALESHNVKVAAGEIDEDLIPGVIELDTVKGDWEEWNREPWPGLDEAREMSAPYLDANGDPVISSIEKKGYVENDNFREDLDQRWYRRRVGIIPPDSSSSFRPLTVDLVERSFQPHEPLSSRNPSAVALDVARKGGDMNVLMEHHGDHLKVAEQWRGTDHVRSRELFVEPNLSSYQGIRFAVDATGEGSGLADEIMDQHGKVLTVRWSAGKNAVDGDMFKNYWTEGLYHLGKFLKNGGIVRNRELQNQLMAAAQTIEFDEKYYANREREVLVATPKDKVAEEYGESPDYLDAAVMACWANEVDMSSNQSGFIISR